MGKYTEVLRGLPTYRGEDATTAEKINAKRLEIGPKTPAEAAAGYRAARDRKEELEKQLAEAQIDVTAWEETVHEVYEFAGITGQRLSDGTNVSTFVEPYAQVKDQEAFRAWCLENDLGNRMTLSWMTTNSITKEKLLAKEPPPPGVEVYVRPKIRLARG